MVAIDILEFQESIGNLIGIKEILVRRVYISVYLAVLCICITAYSSCGFLVFRIEYRLIVLDIALFIFYSIKSVKYSCQ